MSRIKEENNIDKLMKLNPDKLQVPDKVLFFEGLDGAGKSSLILDLTKHLYKKSGQLVLVVSPLRYTSLGSVIKDIIIDEYDTHKLSPTIQSILLAAVRKEIEDLIIEYKAKYPDRWVLVDRWIWSNMVYQNKGTLAEELDRVIQQFGKDTLFLPPQKSSLVNKSCIYLDVTYAASKDRLHKRAQAGDSLDKFELSEEVEFNHRRKAYHSLIHDSGYFNELLVVDTVNSTPEEVLKFVLSHLVLE